MTATTIYCIIVRLYIIAIAADRRRLFDTTLNADCRRPTTTPTTVNLENRQPRQPPRDTAMRSIIF